MFQLSPVRPTRVQWTRIHGSEVFRSCFPVIERLVDFSRFPITGLKSAVLAAFPPPLRAAFPGLPLFPGQIALERAVSISRDRQTRRSGPFPFHVTRKPAVAARFRIT